MRRSIFFLSILFLIIIVALIVAPLFISINQYKPKIIALAEEKLNRDIEISGDLEFRIFPSIKVSARNVSISNPRNRQFERDEFVKIDAIKIKLALFPLLTKHIHIDNLQVKDLVVNLMENEGGEKNFVFEDAEVQNAHKEAVEIESNKVVKVEEDGGLGGVEISGDTVHISNGHIYYKDKGQRYEVKKLDLKTSLHNLNKGLKISASADFNDSHFKIKANLRDVKKLIKKEKIDLALEVNSDYLYLGTDIDIATLDKKISGKFNINASTISIQKLLKLVDQEVNSGGIELDNPLDIKANFVLRENNIATKNFKILFNNIALDNEFDYNIDLEKFAGQSHMRIEDDDSLRLALKGQGLESLKISSPIDLVAKYSFSDKHLKLSNINITSFDDVIQSEFDIYLNKKTGVYGKIYAANIDIADYLPEMNENKESKVTLTQQGKNASQATPKKIEKPKETFFNWSPEKIDNFFLKDTNAKIDFNIKDVGKGNVKITAIKADLNIENSVLSFNISELKNGSGGNLKSRITLRPFANGIKLHAQATSNYFQLNQLISESLGFNRFYGNLLGGVTANSYGESVKELVANLNSDVNFSIKDAWLSGMSLDEIVKNPQKTMEILKEDNKDKKINFDDMQANLYIREGKAVENSNVRIKAKDVSVNADGSFDLITEKVKITIEPKIKDFYAPILVGGYLTDLRYGIDLEAVAKKELKKVQDRAKKEIENKVKEELKNAVPKELLNLF